VTGPLDEPGDAVHGPLERPLFPVVGVRRTVLHSGEPLRVDHPAEGGRPFGAQGSLVDGTARVAFDMDYRVALGIHQLRTAHGTVRANTGADPVGFFEPRPQGP